MSVPKYIKPYTREKKTHLEPRKLTQKIKHHWKKIPSEISFSIISEAEPAARLPVRQLMQIRSRTASLLLATAQQKVQPHVDDEADVEGVDEDQAVERGRGQGSTKTDWITVSRQQTIRPGYSGDDAARICLTVSSAVAPGHRRCRWRPVERRPATRRPEPQPETVQPWNAPPGGEHNAPAEETPRGCANRSSGCPCSGCAAGGIRGYRRGETPCWRDGRRSGGCAEACLPASRRILKMKILLLVSFTDLIICQFINLKNDWWKKTTIMLIIFLPSSIIKPWRIKKQLWRINFLIVIN